MKDRLPFEIISEKSDMDWIEANPRALRIEYSDFLAREDKREKAETIAKSGRLVVVMNGNELLGAIIPKFPLIIHGLLMDDSPDAFFDAYNNRAIKQKIGGEDGVDLLEKFDDQRQTVLVFDNQMDPGYGFVSADFLKDNLVTDDESNCLFKATHRETMEAGLKNWEHNFEQAFIRLEETRDRIQEEYERNPNALVFMYLDRFIDSTCRQLNIVDSIIEDDRKRIKDMIAPDKTGGNQVTEESRIGEP